MSLAHEALRPQSAEEIAELLREGRDGLRIRAAGTWLQAGEPVRAVQELHLDAFTGVRQYTPDDLTISVGAATTLAELDAVTRANGLWCPLQPWGDDSGTVGATIATATSGPFAEALGRPRDLVLGLEFIDGRGRIVRSGGRVVKNVAGFDLTRLLTGAWGTLGVITEVHLRLRARPTVDRSFYIEGASSESLRAFARGPYAPLAAIPLRDDVASALGRQGRGAWLLRVGGNSAAVQAAVGVLSSLGTLAETTESSWTTLRCVMASTQQPARWKWTPLAHRIKRQFDPHNLLNPGLLGDAS